MNYLYFFNKYYYNNLKKFTKIIFNGNIIRLSNKTKSFSELLKKNKIMENLIIDNIKRAYFGESKGNEKIINFQNKKFVVKTIN